MKIPHRHLSQMVSRHDAGATACPTTAEAAEPDVGTPRILGIVGAEARTAGVWVDVAAASVVSSAVPRSFSPMFGRSLMSSPQYY